MSTSPPEPYHEGEPRPSSPELLEQQKVTTTIHARTEQDTSREFTQQEPPKRKLFGWLSSVRGSNGSIDRGKDTPLIERRGTVSSTMSNSSSSDRPQSHGEDDAMASAKKVNRISLKDQFKLARMREETALPFHEPKTSRRRSSSSCRGTDGPEETPELPRPGSDTFNKGGRRRVSSNPPTQPSLNLQLPLGSDTGALSASPSNVVDPVDWDLWQEVVYEGPTAVARTSAHELSQATMRGIPSAIRGVVWQVLANSKNEELESVYRDLVARGKTNVDGERDLTPHGTAANQPSDSEPAAAEQVSEEIFSSENSVHLETQVNQVKSSRQNSGSAVSSSITQEPAGPAGTPEAGPKHQSQVGNDGNKRTVEQSSALQKLERAIRRDLGARTSYSKFLLSAGLQDGLFGVCKAYALFDEEVGYAQGM